MLLISTELDEVMALSDRIVVMFKGAWPGCSRAPISPSSGSASNGGGCMNGGTAMRSSTAICCRARCWPASSRFSLAFAARRDADRADRARPGRRLWSLFEASLGSSNGLAETAIRTVPLALCGIGIALAFRAGVFNVGAEGQLFIGGIAAAWVGLQLAGQPQALVLPAMAVAAAIAGALWSGIAGC